MDEGKDGGRRSIREKSTGTYRRCTTTRLYTAIPSPEITEELPLRGMGWMGSMELAWAGVHGFPDRLRTALP